MLPMIRISKGTSDFWNLPTWKAILTVSYLLIAAGGKLKSHFSIPMNLQVSVRHPLELRRISLKAKTPVGYTRPINNRQAEFSGLRV